MVDEAFRNNIETLISEVPRGRVATYGDLASLAGHPYAARIVGGIAHYGNPALPWHRLVNRYGGLANGFPGGRDVQEQQLRTEGVICQDSVVIKFEELRWRP